MLDIEIMKWGCGLTQGFEIFKYEGEDCWSLEGIRLNRLNSLIGMMVDYPLFLQRIRQGINNNYDLPIDIEFVAGELYIVDTIVNLPIDVGEVLRDNDEGLEQAIEYIYNMLDT